MLKIRVLREMISPESLRAKHALKTLAHCEEFISSLTDHATVDISGAKSRERPLLTRIAASEVSHKGKALRFRLKVMPSPNFQVSFGHFRGLSQEVFPNSLETRISDGCYHDLVRRCS